MAVDIKKSVSDWGNKNLSDNSKLDDTKDYVNFAINTVSALANQTSSFSPTTLSSTDSWNTLDDNSVYYFNALGGTGAPLLSDLGVSTGYVLNVKNDNVSLLMQLVIGSNGYVGLRFSTSSFSVEPWNYLGTTSQLNQNALDYVASAMANYDLSSVVDTKIAKANADNETARESLRQYFETSLAAISTSLELYYSKKDIDDILSVGTQVKRASFLTADQINKFNSTITEAQS